MPQGGEGESRDRKGAGFPTPWIFERRGEVPRSRRELGQDDSRRLWRPQKPIADADRWAPGREDSRRLWAISYVYIRTTSAPGFISSVGRPPVGLGVDYSGNADLTIVDYTHSALKSQPSVEDRHNVASKAGLCTRCWWLRVLSNGRTRFVYCALSQEDDRFSRYPSLPVVQCRGFVESPARSMSGGPERGDGSPGDA